MNTQPANTQSANTQSANTAYQHIRTDGHKGDRQNDRQENHTRRVGMAGTVFLVGAGAGDEGLLTLKGARMLALADVVLYDHLANSALLRHCSPHAALFCVGKRSGEHSVTQDETNHLLVRFALEGKTVVRLKGGDPFIFGRGGEEAQILAQSGIPFEIVPGVTAGIAAAAYAGIPLTHRDHSKATLFVTGHERERLSGDALEASSTPTPELDWKLLAAFDGTIVFYMGVHNLANIAQNLVRHGKNPDTPVAIVENGTLPTQRVMTGSLATITYEAERQNVQTPAIIIIGDVVTVRDELAWFEQTRQCTEQQPLCGVRVLLTQAPTTAPQLGITLQAAGADVRELPAIQLETIQNNHALTNELNALHRYNTIAFTSTTAAHVFFRALFEQGYDARTLAHCRIAVVGSETARAVREYGIRPDIIPEVATGAHLAFVLRELARVNTLRILVPCNTIANTQWLEELARRGTAFYALPVYSNSLPHYSPERIHAAFRGVQYVVFASPSAVRNADTLCQQVDLKGNGSKEVSVKPIFDKSTIIAVAIGSTTANAAREQGYKHVIEAANANADGLADAILQHRTAACERGFMQDFTNNRAQTLQQTFHQTLQRAAHDEHRHS